MLLKDLLKLEQYSYLKLYNEGADLNREVVTIESTETPDIISYMEEKSILLTTAMHYENKQESLVELIKQLNDKESAALAIKTNRFLKDISPQVRAISEELSFPILIIPANKTLGEVYRQLLMTVWSNTQDDLALALNSQKIFLNLLLTKPSIQSILYTLSTILEMDVVLINPFGNVEDSAPRFSTTYSYGSFRDLVDQASFEESCSYSTYIEDRRGKSHRVSIHRMVVAACYPYYLLILDVDKLELSSYSFIIEQAMFALSFTISRNLSNQYFELESIQNKFLSFITASKDSSSEEFYRYYIERKLDYPKAGRVVSLKVEGFESLFPINDRKEGYVLIYKWLKEKFKKEQLYPISKENFYLLLTSRTLIDDIIEDINKHIETLERILSLKINIYIGPKFISINQIHQSYKGCIDSIENGVPYKDYDHIRVSLPASFDVLMSHVPSGELEYFCQSTLGDLYDSKNTNYKDFRKTLKVWLLNNCQISATANELFIHRNTVSYRLEKCKEILGSELKDNMELFNLKVALVMIDYNKVDKD